MDTLETLKKSNIIHLFYANKDKKIFIIISLINSSLMGYQGYRVQLHEITLANTFSHTVDNNFFDKEDDAIKFISDKVDEKIKVGFVDDYSKSPFAKHEYVKCWDPEEDEIFYIFEVFPNGSYEEVVRLNAHSPLWPRFLQACEEIINKEN